jgi:hypothetical protein
LDNCFDFFHDMECFNVKSAAASTCPHYDRFFGPTMGCSQYALFLTPTIAQDRTNESSRNIC